MTKGLRLDFGNLPLVEAAIRISLDEPITLTFARIQELYDAVRDDYPRITEPQRWEVAPGVQQQSVSLSPGGPISGVVYEGNELGLRLTIQSHVIVVRWVEQAQENAPDYPRYAELLGATKRALTSVGSAFAITPVIAAVNMSYVNFIQTGDPARVLKDYFSHQLQVAATEEAGAIHQIEISWRDDAGLDLRFRLQSASAQTPNVEEPLSGFQLTTIAGSRIQGGISDSTYQVLDRVHARLQHLFQEAISDKAKNEWQLRVIKDA